MATQLACMTGPNRAGASGEFVMRDFFGVLCVCALGVMPLVGCSDTTGEGGSGGSAGFGGVGGAGGMPGPECEIAADCYEGNPCTVPACTGGICDATPVEDGEKECGGTGTCQQGSCRVACTEQGIRDAIAADGGRGPYTFDCDGPTTVVTVAEIAIDRDVILDGEGNLTVDGDLDHRVFSVPERVTAELRGLTVARGRIVADVDDFQRAGAGILNGGDLALVNCTVRDNAADHDEACYDPDPFDMGCVGIGGGIESGPFGSLTLKNSTVVGNSADVGGGISKFGFASLTVTNSTVSGNTAREAAGIGNGPDGRLTLRNSTVAENTGPAIENYGSATIESSLIGGECMFGAAIVSGGYNIESPGDTCGFDQEGDQVNVTEGQLDLDALADNGGLTMTHALGEGSAAINVIPADMCDADEDQRGVARPQGDACDVGAFELEVAP